MVFGSFAEHYDHFRPGPALTAVNWLVPPGSQLAVYLGAGTGALARLLAARGVRAVGVDPDRGMLRKLATTCPGARAVQGVGEHMPVRNGAVDAVIASSSWHWMQPGLATREIARVLRPGGWFGIVYTRRDTTMEWVADIERFLREMPLVRRLRGMTEARGTQPDRLRPVMDRERPGRNPTVPTGGTFCPPESREFRWVKPMTPAEIVGFFTSYGGVLRLPAQPRHQLTGQLARYVADHQEIQGRDRVDFPLVSHCWRMRRRPPGQSHPASSR
jgi:SAM-dependent methyltransferase